MSVGEAVNVFTKLTIGDGLVSQVPAFLISLAAGLIVTRSSSDTDLGRDVTGQLFGRRGVLAVAAVFLVALSFTALPKLPLLTLAAALGDGGLPARRRPGRPAEATTAEPADAERDRDRGHAGRHEPAVGADGRPAPRRPARTGDRLPADHPGRADPGRRPARPAPGDPPPGGPRPRADRPAGPDSRRDRPGPARVPAQDPGDGGRVGGRLRRPAAGRPARRAGLPARRPRRDRPASPASPPSGFTPTAARSPSWRAAGSWKPRPSSPATSARSCWATPTS